MNERWEVGKTDFRRQPIFLDRHSQALRDALQIKGLSPEDQVRARGSSRSYHVRSPFPHYRICWTRGKTKQNSYIFTSNFWNCCAADSAATLEKHSYRVWSWQEGVGWRGRFMSPSKHKDTDRGLVSTCACVSNHWLGHRWREPSLSVSRISLALG